MEETFHFKTSEIFKGDFKPGALNLMLVFQVNCPGCFVYALPVANQIVEAYASKGIKVLALSTAFEDFEYNTSGNTRLLLEKGTLVGETKKALNKGGYEKLPFKLNFDVAFDEIKKYQVKDMDREVDQFCQNVPGIDEKNSIEKRLIRLQTKEYLSHKHMTAFTFDMNRLMGTPSWILFDREGKVFFKMFGHKELEWFAGKIDVLIN